MKWLFRILGGLFILVGIVWFFQGINVLLGNMMSGHIQYSILGVLVAAVGAALIYYSFRRPKTN